VPTSRRSSTSSHELEFCSENCLFVSKLLVFGVIFSNSGPSTYLDILVTHATSDITGPLEALHWPFEALAPMASVKVEPSPIEEEGSGRLFESSGRDSSGAPQPGGAAGSAIGGAKKLGLKSMMTKAMPVNASESVAQQNLTKLSRVARDVDLLRATFKTIKKEVQTSPFYVPLARDADANLSWSDHAAYYLENLISSEPTSRFSMLVCASSVLCFAFAAAWALFVTPTEDVFDFWSALFMAMQVTSTHERSQRARKREQCGPAPLASLFWVRAVCVAFASVQVMITGGFEGGINHFDQRVLFFLIIVTGIIFLSTLIGLITDTVRPGRLHLLRPCPTRCP